MPFFWVFGMTRSGIEPWSHGPLANTLLIWPMARFDAYSLSIVIIISRTHMRARACTRVCVCVCVCVNLLCFFGLLPLNFWVNAPIFLWWNSSFNPAEQFKTYTKTIIKIFRLSFDWRQHRSLGESGVLPIIQGPQR